MTFEKFKNDFMAELAERIGSEAEIHEVNAAKNNGMVFTGLTIHKSESKIEPTVYLEKYYEKMQDGFPMAELVEIFLNEYESHRLKDEIDFSYLYEFENVRDNIFFKVVNTGLNEERLKKLPHVDYLDLSLIFYYRVDELAVEGGTASLTITNKLAKTWRVDPIDLYLLAKKNTGRKQQAIIRPIFNVLKEMVGEEALNGMCEEEMLPQMFVLANAEKMNGASAIFYDGLLKGFADSLEQDLYIIPSSVHEAIILPAGCCDEDSANLIKSLIPNVNAKEVEACEVLSDNLYFYSRKDDTLRIA